MERPAYKVVACEIIGPYILRVGFDDGTWQEIRFWPVLVGAVYGPLQDLSLFNQVGVDPQSHRLIWPNGAGFDSTTLHDWPQHIGMLATNPWLATAGIFADDPALLPMLDEIYRNRDTEDE